MKVKGTKNVTV